MHDLQRIDLDGWTTAAEWALAGDRTLLCRSARGDIAKTSKCPYISRSSWEKDRHHCNLCMSAIIFVFEQWDPASVEAHSVTISAMWNFLSVRMSIEWFLARTRVAKIAAGRNAWQPSAFIWPIRLAGDAFTVWDPPLTSFDHIRLTVRWLFSNEAPHGKADVMDLAEAWDA